MNFDGLMHMLLLGVPQHMTTPLSNVLYWKGVQEFSKRVKEKKDMKNILKVVEREVKRDRGG